MGKSKEIYQRLRERYVDTFNAPNELYLRCLDTDINVTTNHHTKKSLGDIKLNYFYSSDEVFYGKLKEIKK